MLWLRRRCFDPAVLLAIVVCSACGRTISLTRLPPGVNANQLRDEILASASPQDFVPAAGHGAIVKDPLIFGSKVRGTVEPHRASHEGNSLVHKKVLARIMVDKKYRELTPDVWNYYALVNLSTDPDRPEWVAAYASAGNRLVLRELTVFRHEQIHPGPKARWQFNSSGVPWATCGGTMCCCEGHGCNTW